MAKVENTLRESLPMIASTKIKDKQNYYEYQPHGVLAIIGPYNFPLHLPNGNLVAALATGNTVVLKPSDKTPFTGQMIAECFHEANFPAGVFNLVQGGASVGEALVEHRDVNGILFVGSDQVGGKINRSILGDP